METINDPKRRNAYIDAIGLRESFRGEMPKIFLLHYKPGELLTNPFSTMTYLQFIVEGELLLYDMPDENSTIVLQTSYNYVNILGDFELVGSKFTPLFVEAKTDVYTLALYLEQNRQRLLEDPVFLCYLCRCLANKLNGAVMNNRQGTLRNRVLVSLQYSSNGDRMTNIGGLAHSLGVSTRQLLRVLKDLCEEDVLEHPSKGVYIVKNKPGG